MTNLEQKLEKAREAERVQPSIVKNLQSITNSLSGDRAMDLDELRHLLLMLVVVLDDHFSEQSNNA